MGNNNCRASHAPKTLIALVAVASLLACEQPVAPDEFTPPVFGFGNGAPTGAHYNLNWIGVPQGKNATTTNNNGHVIFVSLVGNTKILLCQSGVGTACLNVSGFQVLDANGTDGFASFALPSPDPNNTGNSLYSVYVRALGTPGGTATNTTCGTDPAMPSDTICSVLQVDLSRTKGQQTFQNVTKEMLYVYAILPGQTTISRVPLFDSKLQNYFWNYDNNGLKLAQFRFYPVSTTVP